MTWKWVRVSQCQDSLLLKAVRSNGRPEVEVTDPKEELRQKARGEGKSKVELESYNGGRQENSLRTVRSNSQVLYTNTGWSVHSPLGQALVQEIGVICTYMEQGMSQLYVGVPNRTSLL